MPSLPTLLVTRLPKKLVNRKGGYQRFGGIFLATSRQESADGYYSGSHFTIILADRLDQLKNAQSRIYALQEQGVAMTSRQARIAVNSLVHLIRGATPQELRAFEEWKAARRPAG